MKTNKKYSVIVMAIAIIASLVLFGCPDDSSSNGGGTTATSNAFNLANCYRIFGDDDCREAATGLVSGEVIGTVKAATGATAFAITAGNTNTNFAISSAGVLTAAKAVTTNATFSQELTITITGGADAGTKKITVDNSFAKATVYEAPLGARQMDAAGGVSALTLTETTVASECAGSVKCLSSTFTGAWGGWFFGLATGNTSIDLTPYTNVFIRYNANGVETAAGKGFEFKMESAGVNGSAYKLDGEGTPARVGITANTSYQTAQIPLSVLMGAKDGNRGGDGAGNDDTAAGLDISKITVPIGIWNQGMGKTLIIAQVYAR